MIHNISIATADDITYFGDDVKYLPFIFTQDNYHLGMLSQLVRKDYCFRPIFRQFVVNRFGNSPMATECILVRTVFVGFL